MHTAAKTIKRNEVYCMANGSAKVQFHVCRQLNLCPQLYERDLFAWHALGIALHSLDGSLNHLVSVLLSTSCCRHCGDTREFATFNTPSLLCRQYSRFLGLLQILAYRLTIVTVMTVATQGVRHSTERCQLRQQHYLV